MGIIKEYMGMWLLDNGYGIIRAQKHETKDRAQEFHKFMNSSSVFSKRTGSSKQRELLEGQVALNRLRKTENYGT